MSLFTCKHGYTSSTRCTKPRKDPGGAIVAIKKMGLKVSTRQGQAKENVKERVVICETLQYDHSDM
jgi:hypothetical protein